MKKFLNNFRNKGNYNLGYMFIPQHYYAGDKQEHTLRGMFFAVSYFLLRYDLFQLENYLAIIISLLLVVGIAYFNEFRNINKPNRKFSHYDVMAEVIGWFIIVIIGGNLIPIIF